jgi:hypothetical protein
VWERVPRATTWTSPPEGGRHRCRGRAQLAGRRAGFIRGRTPIKDCGRRRIGAVVLTNRWRTRKKVWKGHYIGVPRAGRHSGSVWALDREVLSWPRRTDCLWRTEIKNMPASALTESHRICRDLIGWAWYDNIPCDPLCIYRHHLCYRYLSYPSVVYFDFSEWDSPGNTGNIRRLHLVPFRPVDRYTKIYHVAPRPRGIPFIQPPDPDPSCGMSEDAHQDGRGMVRVCGFWFPAALCYCSSIHRREGGRHGGTASIDRGHWPGDVGYGLWQSSSTTDGMVWFAGGWRRGGLLCVEARCSRRRPSVDVRLGSIGVNHMQIDPA